MQFLMGKNSVGLRKVLFFFLIDFFPLIFGRQKSFLARKKGDFFSGKFYAFDYIFFFWYSEAIDPTRAQTLT